MKICNTYVSVTYIFSDLALLTKPIYSSRQQYHSFMTFLGPKGWIFLYLSHDLECLVYNSLKYTHFYG